MKQYKTKTGPAAVLRAAAALFAVMTLLSACSGKKAAQADEKSAAGEGTVFSVKTQEVEIKTLHSYIETNGNIEATRQIEVYPDIGGKLTQVSVTLGSRVKKGQVIAEIDPSTPGTRYAVSPVIAPISGSITSVPLQTGTTVTQNTAIAVIGDVDDLQISVNIPERYVAVLKTGLKAVMTLEAYPGVEFAATVVRVSPVVDAISRTKQIHLTLDNEDPRINAGMFPKIKLYTTSMENAITIPQESIVSGLDGTYVFIVNDDNTVSRRMVVQGATVDGLCEIKSGLAAGETIVSQGQQVLTDGARVKDIGEKSSGSR